jgi:tetratricopeptide (TPR) repeat protein
LRYRYGLLLRGRGKTSEAIQHFQAAVDINPSYVKARLKLGLALRDDGRMNEAIKQLTEALAVKSEYVDLHYKLGLMYCDKIKFALAVEHFETAQKENPDNMNVHANLALALQNMGLIDRARASWQAVCELEPQSPMAFKAQRELVCLKPVW